METLVEDANPDTEGKLPFDEFYGRHRSDSDPALRQPEAPDFEELPFDAQGFAEFEYFSFRTFVPGVPNRDYRARARRSTSCTNEETWDRFQRVTLTT